MFFLFFALKTNFFLVASVVKVNQASNGYCALSLEYKSYFFEKSVFTEGMTNNFCSQTHKKSYHNYKN